MADSPLIADRSGRLPASDRVLAVCAHPDDESFGLGAVLAGLVDAGARVTVLCFTHGEASSLHTARGDLGAIRAEELASAARCLGVAGTELLDYRDGGLDDVPLPELVGHVDRLVQDTGADLLVAFDEGGITGHPDHERATEAALEASADRALPVLAWAIPDRVAHALNGEFGTTFVGRSPVEIDLEIDVDRSRQVEAIGRHASQSTDNPVLWRRLELSGNVETLRFLGAPPPAPGS